MSPRRLSQIGPRVETELRRVSILLGGKVHEARIQRGWPVAELAARAGISADMVYRIEAGASASAQTAARLAVALDCRLLVEFVDVRRRAARRNLSVDVVHSAMAEMEAAHLRSFGFGIGIDEPYQHYQFAGRADLVAWDLERRALLHIENRTRFPDFQESAGAFNAKRAYLGGAIAERLGLSRWSSETHVIAGLWSSEVLHAVRIRAESFRSLCPDGPQAVEDWWSGRPPASGWTSIFIALDPLANGRARPFIDLDHSFVARPRHRGYAAVATRLDGAT